MSEQSRKTIMALADKLSAAEAQIAELEHTRDVLHVSYTRHLLEIEDLKRQFAERGEAVWCASVEVEGHSDLLYQHTSEPIPNADAFRLYTVPQVPAGMTLVPTEITHEMISAWQSAFNTQLNRRMNGSKKKFAAGVIESCEVVAYRAMISAAPQSGVKP